MFEAKIKSLTIIIAATLLSISAFAQVGGTVVDQADGSPVAGAAVTIKGNQTVWDVTDSLGRFKLKATGGTLQITCLGYKTLTTAVRKDGRYSLAPDSFAINEVVVTATESHGLTSSSRIGQDAIAHIQPSSFADLLELLPGGRSAGDGTGGGGAAVRNRGGTGGRGEIPSAGGHRRDLRRGRRGLFRRPGAAGALPAARYAAGGVSA